ncbi:MAG: hypothetical protein NVSMB12_21210 [Acidimicrobiales bacterium]
MGHLEEPAPRVTFRMDPHVSRLDPERGDYDAIIAAHRRAVESGEPGYADPATGLFVQTAATLWARGTCCDQGCRHCPYVGLT